MIGDKSRNGNTQEQEQKNLVKTCPIILHALPYPTRSAASRSTYFLKRQGTQHHNWHLAPVIQDRLRGWSVRLWKYPACLNENASKSKKPQISGRKARGLLRPKKGKQIKPKVAIAMQRGPKSS